jgi:hypothetical protein
VTKAEDAAAVAFIFGASGDTPVTFFLPPRNQLIFFKGLHPASTKYATAAAVINNISMIRRSLSACIYRLNGGLFCFVLAQLGVTRSDREIAARKKNNA